jgi:acyl carrier protein
MPDNVELVISAIRDIGRLGEISADQDFYNEGLNSMAALTVLVELEAQFNVSIPDTRFVECRTAQQLSDLILELQAN